MSGTATDAPAPSPAPSPAPAELDEVVELDDDEEEEIRAENARSYPADLPAGPEAATVDEMRKVLEVVELGVRNVEVDFERPGNVGHARAFRKLQTKLNVLRFQAMSFKWSPGFVTVLRQARYMRVLPILGAGGNAGAAPKSRLRREGKCCQVCGTEEHACEYVFELLGSPCVQHAKRDANGRTMLKCEPCELSAEFERLQGEDAWIAEETDRQKSAKCPTWSKRPPPGYLGMFAVGSTCLQRVRLAMWAQSFVVNLAGTADERLGRIAPAELERREANGSIHMPTATEERARTFLQQIERAESLLRAGSSAGVGASMPVPDSYLGYQRPIWDRVVEWNKMARANTEAYPLLPQALRGQKLLDRADNEWDAVQCFRRWKDDREGERESDSSATEEDSEDEDYSESRSEEEEEEDADADADADDGPPSARVKRRRPAGGGPARKKKKKRRHGHGHGHGHGRRHARDRDRGAPKRKRASREEDDGEREVGRAAPAQGAEGPPPRKRRQRVIHDDEEEPGGSGAQALAEEATDDHGFSVRELAAATAHSIAEQGAAPKSSRAGGAGASDEPPPSDEEEERDEEEHGPPADDEDRLTDPGSDRDDDGDAAAAAPSSEALAQARVVAQLLAHAHSEAAAAVAAAAARATAEADLARSVRRAQARFERQRQAAAHLVAHFGLEGMGLAVEAAA